MSMTRRSRTLYRDPNEKMIGGVCSGLAHYFDIDTILVRVAFVVIALLGGGGVLAYVILWAILDPAPPGVLGAAAGAEPLALDDNVDTDTIDTGISLDQGESETIIDAPSPELRTDEP